MSPVQIPDVILFTPGRACTGPIAVVLHEWNGGLESLDAAMLQCPRRRPAQSPGCHTSFHYGIGGDCAFHQYIDITDTAWGFGLNPATCPTPPCPLPDCLTCNGLTQAQYEPTVNGIYPTIAFTTGPDGTANCNVLHVAAPALFPTNSSLGSGSCCNLNDRAYFCLVQSLCQIFTAADLVPSLSTMLVHCDEHICLDTEQLVADILACLDQPTPVQPPCTCIPTTAQLCAALATVGTSEVLASSVLGEDCLFHDIGVTVDLVDCSGDPVVSGQNIITKADLSTSGSPDSTPLLLTLNSVTGCIQTEVPVSTCDGINTNSIGVACDSEGTFLQYGRQERPGLSIGRSSDLPTDVLPLLNGCGEVTDLQLLDHAPATVYTLGPAGATRCLKNDFWLKNITNAPVSIAAGTGISIDGQLNETIILDGTIVDGYPYNNDGGESVHLVWEQSTLSYWIV